MDVANLGALDLTALAVEGAKWLAIADGVLVVLTVLAFVLGWGIRFRLVGVASFTAVLVAGLFALSLGLFERTTVPGAARYALVYDSGAARATIAVPLELRDDREALTATLQQAASDLFSPGRLGPQRELTVQARALEHGENGASKTVYLGQIRRSLTVREDADAQIELF
ncbi:MAG: Ycf51 family protein [Cyanophyceae cyanobacterium]